MSFDARHLAELLPAIYRLRDAERDGPLYVLLSVIAEQIAALEEDVAQLYDDQFIETCAEWVVPYIGDLIGHRQTHSVAPQVRSSRAEVANTIGFRRRKGTVAVLEALARAGAGWSALAVEFFQKLATTQYLNHLRLGSLGSADLRDWQSLERLNGPFDTLPHTVDVRGIVQSRGRYNIPNIGIFLWRLASYSVSCSPACKLDDRRYMFSPLGNNVNLYTRPRTDTPASRRVDAGDLPLAIGRRLLASRLDEYYGPGKSVFVHDVLDQGKIVVCNLSDLDSTGATWAHVPAAGKIAIDPVPGRIAYAEAPASPPLVSFNHAFSANVGGGEYDRANSLDFSLRPVVQTPSPHSTIKDALSAANSGGVVEVTDNGRYDETPFINLALPGERLEFRAANSKRPALSLAGDLLISGAHGTEATLSGLLIGGGAVRVVETSDHQSLHLLRLRHCTLVPGLALSADGSPRQVGAASLIVETTATIVEIDHCILGGLRLADGSQARIAHSVVDVGAPSNAAFAGIDGQGPGGPLRVENSTVIGKIHTSTMTLASNSIFIASLGQGDTWAAPIVSERRQAGCVRFSYMPFESWTPRRYRCQPADDADASRVGPIFTSLRFGDPGYCQLSRRCALEIRQGADDGAEMGVFHDLFEAQRENNLQSILDEYLRFSMEAGFFYAS